MDVAGFVIMGVRVTAMIMAAIRGLAGGQQVEETEHRKPETADKGDRPEIRSQVFVDAAAGGNTAAPRSTRARPAKTGCAGAWDS
jgi:hypothetical protein